MKIQTSTKMEKRIKEVPTVSFYDQSEDLSNRIEKIEKFLKRIRKMVIHRSK